MKEYRGCKYKTLTEIRNDKVIFPNIQVLVAPFMDSGYIPLNINYSLETVESNENPDEFLDEICKEAIDDYLLAYNHYKDTGKLI